MRVCSTLAVAARRGGGFHSPETRGYRAAARQADQEAPALRARLAAKSCRNPRVITGRTNTQKKM